MVIEKIPYIDSIINCRVYDFLKNPFSFIRFIKELRKIRYEVIIDAGQWERINSVIVCFANKDYSIGFRTKGQFKHIINDAIADHSKNKHEVENFMDLLIPLGIIPAGRKLTFDELQLEYFLTQADREFREKFWIDNSLSDKKVICFHPGCGENGKPREWDTKNYVLLGRKLFNLDNNLRILITGTLTEYELCNRVYIGIKKFAINTAGMYTLEQSAALVEKSSLMICSNTGMLHISTSVGTRTIGLHGPTNPAKWGAYNPRAVSILSDKFCSPCLYLGHDYGCNSPTCMEHITVEQVFSSAVLILYPELILETI
jgi:ADP-heptose:LPS heptosyltransferase